MSSSQQIYNDMFAGNVVKVHCPTDTDYNTLRTALCRHNRLNVALDLTDDSVVASYDAEKKVGTFRLAQPKRKQNANRWKIIESGDSDA